jgi:hypothetical protein
VNYLQCGLDVRRRRVSDAIVAHPVAHQKQPTCREDDRMRRHNVPLCATDRSSAFWRVVRENRWGQLRARAGRHWLSSRSDLAFLSSASMSPIWTGSPLASDAGLYANHFWFVSQFWAPPYSVMSLLTSTIMSSQ